MNEFPPTIVTFALISFNQEKYIEEAILGAFSQTNSPLEIIISDDCSSDNTFKIIQRIVADYKGPHRIIINQNNSNLNIGGQINIIGSLATGDLIVLAAGDDISMPSRTHLLLERWDSLGRPPVVICSNFEAIDISSSTVVLPNEALYRGPFLIENMVRGNIGVLGATTAVSKEIFSAFLPLDSAVRHEDKVLPFRSLLLGGVVTLIDEKMVRYRIQGGISRRKVNSGSDYLFLEMPTFAERTMPDAVQRLADLLLVSPAKIALRRECEKTIIDLQSWIELPRLRGFYIEVWLFKWLRRGARPTTLLKLYLKLRFLKLFNLYYAIKYPI